MASSSKSRNPASKHGEAARPDQGADGIGSALSTMSGPSSATPPAGHAGQDAATADACRKATATAQLAAALPHNPNKAGEYGAAARCPMAGFSLPPPDPLAGASTSSERNASAKAGNGPPPAGVNPATAALDRVRVDSTGQRLTTNQGVPIADNQHSLKAGLRGPTLLEDFILREKLTHFDHERIPERIVHARGSAAHGYFECYDSLAQYTRAALFSARGKRTPVFARFSTVAGERGSADTVRDVRGFAVKFYTDEGNFDLVGNNIPVFFIQDAMKFPDLVHSVKPEPHHGMPQATAAHDTFWDFVSLMPESVHTVVWAMSDRAIPRSYRMMQGFGVHSFRLVNAEGQAVFCKFHWTPKAGTHSLLWDEAVKIAGADPDFHRRDLWEAIEGGAYPEWELGLQIFTEEQAAEWPFDILDSTKIVPEELVPVLPVGRMVLDRNPDNFFAETEQVAFCVAHVVPGIDFSNDPLMHGRIHSYVDTQLSRLGGPNFHELPINAPIAPVHNNQRDGMHRQAIHRGRVAYEPNSLGGGCPFQAGGAGFMSVGHKLAGAAQQAPEDKVRGHPELFAEHYGQARLFWLSQTEVEQQHIVDAFRFELTRVQVQPIRERVVAMLANVDAGLAARVAKGMGFAVPPALPRACAGPLPEYPRSPALSLAARPGDGGIAARRIAIVAADGMDASGPRQLYAMLANLGAVPRYVGADLGRVEPASGAAVDVEITLDTAPSVLWDAVLVPHGASAALGADPHLGDFLRDAWKHCKTLLALGDGRTLLEQAGVKLRLADGNADPGVLLADPADAASAGQQFAAAIARHRHFERTGKQARLPD